jgi:hypothetical protein
MKEVNKSTELDSTDKKLNISDVSKRYVWFQKDKHGYKFEVKNDKHYQKLKFRYEQQGYVEIPEPPEVDGSYVC